MAGPSIDVGLYNDMRNQYAPGYTLINMGNPANATGLITLINIYANGTCTNVEIAAFTAVGNSMTTRGYTSLPNLANGDNEFDASAGDFAPFEIRVGDYIGAYVTATMGIGMMGGILAGPGIWKSLGDQIPCSGRTFDVEMGNPELAIYGEGFQLGHIHIGAAWKVIQNIQINVGDAWKQITLGSKINIGDAWKDIFH